MNSSPAKKILLAPWVLPISRPPIPQGAVAVEGEKIAGVGTQKEILRQFHGKILEFPHRALMPALVNAHVHLELSGLRGQVPGDGSLVSWVERLISLKQAEVGAGLKPAPTKDMAAGIGEAIKTGTGLVGEVSNGGLSYPLLAQSGLYATFFLEILSFQQEKANTVFVEAQKIFNALPSYPHIIKTLSPHAPYTVSPPLFTLIKNFLETHKLPSSFHLGESPEEVEFLETGQGPLRDLLEQRGAWEPRWQAPKKSPAAYWETLQPPKRMMLVHLTQVRGEDLKMLAQEGTLVCLCPRSNAYIGLGQPDLESMLAEGLRPALGTDSLASNEDLNLFNEMAYIRENFPVPNGTILKMGALWGAQALGWGKLLGSLEAGKLAQIIAVEVSGNDPEAEILERGEQNRVCWIRN